MGKFFIIIFLFIQIIVQGQECILPGAAQTGQYLELLKGKRIALVGNHTSKLADKHLLDSLLACGMNVVKLFSPEHGFRGDEDAGEKISTSHDRKTGIPLVSLYGKHVKPQPRDLNDVDLVLFDLQDVGVRFYTYLSTLHYVMEACAECGKQLIVLDRPNPNGFYIDGPVLQDSFRSFVGLHPVPVVYGMTIGEYAQMINNEGWLNNKVHCSLYIVPCCNYNHSTRISLPVKPSPNLPDKLSVRLYPSLAFFEGTSVSIGRGTDTPFTMYGSPQMQHASFTFIPVSIPGMSKAPLYEGVECRGWDLRVSEKEILSAEGEIDLSYLLNAYENSPEKDTFFNNYFNLLAGNSKLQQQIKDGSGIDAIRASWQNDLEKFRIIRKKYLLYPD